MAKYGNKKTVVDGVKFDSILESRRYQELKLMEAAGAITDLVLQPRYELIPSFVDASGKRHRKTEYVADFAYRLDGKIKIEDVKGMRNRLYVMKAKLFLYVYPEYELIEVTR